eukprot:m.163949 g.163949  ORF g.163949 m.163949 type:complete len:66 (+) comp31314_c1_seq11:613-810(+)
MLYCAGTNVCVRARAWRVSVCGECVCVYVYVCGIRESVCVRTCVDETASTKETGRFNKRFNNHKR